MKGGSLGCKFREPAIDIARVVYDDPRLAPNPDGTVLLLPMLGIAQLADGRWDFDSAGRPQALPMSLPAEGEAVIPTGQATPVPCAGQYPPGFLARYCWW